MAAKRDVMLPGALQADEEAHAPGSCSEGELLRSTATRSKGLNRYGLVAAVVGAVVCIGVLKTMMAGGAPAASTASLGEEVQLSAQPCERPADFCDNSKREDKFSMKDCDGDGILDPYCEGGELLRFGFISSKDGCKNNWPNGLCRSNVEPPGEKKNKAAGNEITIIHFNDVYQVSGVLEKGTRKGGMSRAAHVIKKERERNPDRTFVVFAGDLLSPSVLSDLFEGKQMIDILNEMKLDAASLGNHEFDFGVDTLAERVKESQFPWLNINLQDESGKLLPGTTERKIKTVPFTPAWSEEEKSSKVCLFGSAYDVRETMFKDKERVKHVDTMESSLKEAAHLREEEKCDVVLALTHQFSRFDCEMSKQMGDKVDLILGGHDHSTELTTVCGHAPYVKADSDLKTQWIMTLWLDDDGKVQSVDGRLLTLTDVDLFDEDIHGKIVDWEVKGEAEMGKKIGCASTDMDAVAAHVRQHETNLGDWFTDAVRAFHKTDVVLINGGTIRGNKVFEKGDLTKAVITSMHPFGNAVAKIYATGKELRAYVEKQLDCYQDVCGNFVQVSGLKYAFDPSAAKGQRLKSLKHTSGAEVTDDETLTVGITDYMLSSSPLRHNKLFGMTTLNDAVPIVLALFEAAKKAGDDCIAPELDGRITKV